MIQGKSRQASEIWEAALGELELQISKANYRTWLKETVGLSYDDEQFTVGVPNVFTLEWLEKRLFALIKKTLDGIIGYPLEVRFQVLQGQQGETHSSQARHPALYPSSLNPKYTFSSFIVGSCNRLAHAAALGVAENPGNVYNPLFIYSGVGLGKTHLLHATGHAVEQNQWRVIYVTAEQFTNEFIASIRERSTEEFRNKFRNVDVLLIDDVHFLAGKEQTQEGLFHTFNALHAANRQIILSSDQTPKALTLLERRLRSRFEWGLIVDIQPPDLETRIAILQAKAQELKVSMPIDVLNLIARKVQNNVRELEGALNRVVAYAKLMSAPITEELALEGLADLTSSEPKRSMTPSLIIQAVADYFQVDQDMLYGKGRGKSIALARQIAMYLLREELGSRWTEIGQAFGGRDHSTALHAHRKIAAEMEESPALRKEILQLREQLYSQSG